MKTMMIIGAGPGLADALARRFAEAGWRVVLASRNMHRMNDLARDIAGLGGEAHIFSCDAADMFAVDAVVRAAIAKWDIDLLVYNAAVIRKATLVEQPLEMIASDLLVHAGGAFAAARVALPEMAKRKSGTAIFSGGGLAVSPLPEYVSLGIGKAALRNLAQALSRDPAYAALKIAYVMIDAAVEGDTTRQIADLYWRLANESPGNRGWEVRYPEHAEIGD